MSSGRKLVSSEGLKLGSMETWRRRSDDMVDSVEEESHADEADAIPGVGEERGEEEERERGQREFGILARRRTSELGSFLYRTLRTSGQY